MQRQVDKSYAKLDDFPPHTFLTSLPDLPPCLPLPACLHYLHFDLKCQK